MSSAARYVNQSPTDGVLDLYQSSQLDNIAQLDNSFLEHKQLWENSTCVGWLIYIEGRVSSLKMQSYPFQGNNEIKQTMENTQTINSNRPSFITTRKLAFPQDIAIFTCIFLVNKMLVT